MALWQTSVRLQNRRRFIYDFYAVSYDYWLLLITYQIHEKHFVRNQEYWNEDWNKSSNGEWTLQGINIGVLLSIWRPEFLGIPFRNKFIMVCVWKRKMLVSNMNFKPCPDGFSLQRLKLSSFSVSVSFVLFVTISMPYIVILRPCR